MPINEGERVAFEYQGEMVNARVFLIEDTQSTKRRVVVHIDDKPQPDQPYTEVSLEIERGDEDQMSTEDLSRSLSEKYR